MTGLFVNIEGIDGSGKSTQVRRVVELLSTKGYDLIATQEPTKGKIGVLLREYLRDPDSLPEVDALLFAADRIEHYNNEIKPLKSSGKIVVTDRYTNSSIVYQGSQGADIEWIKMINNQVPEPDMSFYLEISIDTALERIHSDIRKNLEKFENEKELNRVKPLYDKLKAEQRFIIIDGEQEIDKITQEICERIEKNMRDMTTVTNNI